MGDRDQAHGVNGTAPGAAPVRDGEVAGDETGAGSRGAEVAVVG
jgi:hypothetical protein